MHSRATVIVAVSFLTVALICSLTAASRLEAISQPSQGGGSPYPDIVTGGLFTGEPEHISPDCLVTPKQYVDTFTYYILECCKTSYSGPTMQTQTTWCANAFAWMDHHKDPYYNRYDDIVTNWGLLPPNHFYLKNIVHGSETFNPSNNTSGNIFVVNGTNLPPIECTGPPLGKCICSVGVGVVTCRPAPGGNATNPGNNTLPTFPITKVHNPASPGLFSSVGNATNPGNNTGTLPPGSIFKVPPGNTSSNNIRNTTNPGNITGTLPPNVFTLAGNGTNTSNNTGPVLPGLAKPTGNLTNALPSTGNNSVPLPPLGSMVNLTRNATHEPPG